VGAAVALAATLAPAGTAAGARWGAEARLGGAWNLPLPLVVRQPGQPDLRLTARWATRPLRFPLYYALRALRWQDRRAWALDLTHHKIHLEDPPPEISEFAVSHGYNLVTVQRLVEARRALAGWGAGLVVAHPENEVRGRRLDESQGLLGSGYYVAGPTLSALIVTLPPERKGLYVSAELRVTLSFARLPVADGSATVPNAALHATLGLGWIEGP
jgi:hypothetical protein